MEKIQLVDVMNKLLKTKRNTDNYADGVLDMYNECVRLLEAK